MNKAHPLKLMRTRLFTAWVSSFASMGFLLSLFFCCMCGPFCGAATTESGDQPAVEVGGCCSSCAPAEEPASEAPGDSCCEVDLAEYAFQEAVADIQIFVSLAVSYVVDIFQPVLVESFFQAPAIGYAALAPPSFLRFQSFLI